MNVLFAASPILVILTLMLGFRMSAARAGVAGLTLATLVADLVFGYGGEGDPGRVGAIGGATAEGAFMALTILWILFAALSLHELQVRRGALDLLQRSVARITGQKPIAAILIGWFFALFLEGAAGFGTPIALSAPILVALGFSAVRAVSIALIGHAAGVAFGAIGTPVFAQTAITDIPAREIASQTALLQLVLGGVLAAFLFRTACAEPGGRTVRWHWAGAAATCFLLPFTAIALWVGPELPTIGGALLGAIAFVGLLRMFEKTREGAVGAPPLSVPLCSPLRAAVPYLIVIFLVLATRLIPTVADFVEGFAWHWTLFDTFTGDIRPLHHPGTILLVAFLLGGLLQGSSPAALGAAMVAAASRLVPVTLALVAMLVLSRLMVHSGMIDVLAQAAGSAAGRAWPAFAPAVGALGGFITGSATASNILFASFQRTAALELGLPVAAMVAGQGVGAAIGNIVCPHNIIAGAATVGLAGREWEILRRTIVPFSAYTMLAGLVLYAAVRWT